MKKNRRKLLLALVVSLAVLGLFEINRNINSRIWDVSNLEIENGLANSEIIGFEDAVRLKAKLTDSTYGSAENELRDLEREIFEASGGNATYYHFVGAFTFLNAEDLRGELSTLVVVVDKEDPYIYAADKPTTEIFCKQRNVQWTQSISSYNIDAYKTSVRLSATGQITVSDRRISELKSYSNTIFPVFAFSL